MNINILTEEDLRRIIREELPQILADLLPKPDETPITAKELCRYFGISHVTLTKYRDLGKIPYIKIGKSFRYIRSDVKEALTKIGLV